MNKPPENTRRFVDILFEALDKHISLDWDVDLEMLAANIADDTFPSHEYEVIWFDEDTHDDVNFKPGFYVIPKNQDTND